MRVYMRASPVCTDHAKASCVRSCEGSNIMYLGSNAETHPRHWPATAAASAQRLKPWVRSNSFGHETLSVSLWVVIVGLLHNQRAIS